MKITGKTFGCSWLVINWLFNKRTVLLRESSCKRNYFIDANQIKHSMDNFGPPDSPRDEP